ncbi:MAG: hypothetical protein EZS28_055814, partial [Streblomastix strix]
GLKEMYENSWNRNSKLTSSNWRKVAEILQGLQRFAASPRQNQINALRIKTDNSSAAFNISTGAAGQALQQIVDQTLQLIQQLDVQLPRLVSAVVYPIREEVLEEVLLQFHVHPTIDIFTNRRNRKCRRFCSLKKDPWAVRHDGLALPWKNEHPRLHLPIALIEPIMNKLLKEEI